MSDTKNIRAALKAIGDTTNYTVFNDRRNKERRIKINGCQLNDFQEMAFRAECRKLFGDRYIAAQHVIKRNAIYANASVTTGSLAVYLKKS